MLWSYFVQALGITCCFTLCLSSSSSDFLLDLSVRDQSRSTLRPRSPICSDVVLNTLGSACDLWKWMNSNASNCTIVSARCRDVCTYVCTAFPVETWVQADLTRPLELVFSINNSAVMDYTLHILKALLLCSGTCQATNSPPAFLSSGPSHPLTPLIVRYGQNLA